MNSEIQYCDYGYLDTSGYQEVLKDIREIEELENRANRQGAMYPKEVRHDLELLVKIKKGRHTFSGGAASSNSGQPVGVISVAKSI